MVNERFAVLLSPPTSPRMSDASAKKNDPYNPYATRDLYQPPSASSQVYGGAHEHPYDHSRPSLPSYNGQVQSMSSTSQSGHQGYAPLDRAPAGNFDHRWNSQSRQAGDNMDAQQPSYPLSASASPVDRLTPRSPSNAKDQQDDEDLIEFGGDDQEDDSDKPPMTAAELRAAKRKMKRFRLTHNQTRFLMSEFARQAHPDAAHRERLAREIPGLSARQVQVWFQNRRAKLKRLTNDDRERMMRSRALPAGFDTTQALHSPFGIQPPTMGGTISNVGPYASYGEQSAIRPLTLDTLRRVPDYDHHGYQYGTPSGVSPALGAFGFTPPQSATEHLSPNSTTSGISNFTLQQHTPYDASRRPPLGLPGSGQAQFPQSSMPRLPLHDRLSRTTGEAGGSPLRTSVSYSALGSSGSHQVHQLERAASFSEHNYGQQRPGLQRNVSNPNMNDQSAYGLGFSYTQAPSYPPTSSTQDTESFRRAPAYGAYAPQYQTGYTAQYPSQQFSNNNSAYQNRGHESTAGDQGYMGLGQQVTAEGPGQAISMPPSY